MTAIRMKEQALMTLDYNWPEFAGDTGPVTEAQFSQRGDDAVNSGDDSDTEIIRVICATQGTDATTGVTSSDRAAAVERLLRKPRYPVYQIPPLQHTAQQHCVTVVVKAASQEQISAQHILSRTPRSFAHTVHTSGVWDADSVRG